VLSAVADWCRRCSSVWVEWEGRPEYCWEELENGELVRVVRNEGDAGGGAEAGKIGADHTQQKPGVVAEQGEIRGAPVHTTTPATPSAVVQASAEEIASRYPGVELPPKWRAVAGGDLRFLEILYKLRSMPLKPVRKGKWPPSTREELSRLVVFSVRLY
jgi:hypothetical protein